MTTQVSPSPSFTKTTTPPDWLGWVSKPNRPYGRGTLDILWSCLFTIFICTWTIQHPMVPGRDEKWQWISIRKVWLMAFTVIAPEMLIGSAIGEYLLANESVDEFKNEISQDWTTTHGFFALMGGFVVKSRNNPPLVIRVSGRGIMNLKDSGSPKPVTKRDIDDRSKADILVKATACFQALWLVIQCCARVQQNLPITPLELATVGFVGCSLVTYVTWFSKPQQVNETITILEAPALDFQTLRSQVNKGWKSDIEISDEYQTSVIKALEEKGRIKTLHYFAGHHKHSMRISMAAGSLFGAVHIIAWNFAFPTRVETIMWRVAAVASTVMPTVLLFLLLISLPQGPLSSINDSYVYPLLKRLGRTNRQERENNAVYGTMRLYLIVALFITFRSQPPSIYTTVDWSKYIPHFS
ncbi:uncharacterized protein BDR25DRAFT_374204 [Lindgomyces ingoldianus]|uniref:Uncharacterized protein n=1 Tax=Lindgomyces ingoldianus TaxID=673940 RepID=A0ACB6QNP6_9PLEO|nr:uncharacterized protein BDR25DRAFT_374204 [Lindgomyces ingoldianus]KAF2467907.1 hypothetical protein BDR25DRAFT_374204 [Lindgomyces ingoldianus]